MPLTRTQKIIFISLILLVGVIILALTIYHRTSLWEPEQHLLTLLPEEPICYVTLKDLGALVKTFNRSEFGKQVAQMPVLAEIKEQVWWKQLVYQKQVWEYEMGGKLDLKAVTGYFGEEAILAIYQREGELSFLLITAVGAQEKLGIEALTAADAINPRYHRLQNEYAGFTINTIVGFPRNFSYTFIGKIGVLSLDPLLVAETLDRYSAETRPKPEGFLSEAIQADYRESKSTAYIDIQALAPLVAGMEAGAFVEQVLGAFQDTAVWTFGNRYEDGVIVSRHRFQSVAGADRIVPPVTDPGKPPLALPAHSALVVRLPAAKQLRTLFGDLDLSAVFGGEVTGMLLTPEGSASVGIPSLVLSLPVNDSEALDAILEIVKQGKPTFAGKPIQYLKPEAYNGIRLQPLQLRLNFLLAVTGGYAVVADHFVFSTTLAGLKSVVDTATGKAAALAAGTFDGRVWIDPERLVPELKRFAPVLPVLASLSGQKLDTAGTQRITENLFPLESLGSISADIVEGEEGTAATVRIVLEE